MSRGSPGRRLRREAKKVKAALEKAGESSDVELQGALAPLLEAWIASRPARGFGLQTYTQEDAEGWMIHIDAIGFWDPPVKAVDGWEIPGGKTIEDRHGLWIGPWASRLIARAELTGKVREKVIAVAREIEASSGGRGFERFDLEVHIPELEEEIAASRKPN